MNIHKNARLSLVRRREMVQDVVQRKMRFAAAARVHGVSVPTVRKWIGRYLAHGEAALADASSRPHLSPRAVAPATALSIVELRRRFLTHARIARTLQVSASTVGRVLRRAGLARWSDLAPSEPVLRYEHEHPGDLVHIDTKRLVRIERMSHRVTGNRRHTVRGIGWEYLFVAVDDHARLGFTQMKPTERANCASEFLHASVKYFAGLGVTVRRVMTDNGPTFRSRQFAQTCQKLGIGHQFTRCYRPQTNGKAERFIQSALREWAYGIPYHHSWERTTMLDRWTHHYNWHRPHQGIGGLAPASRLGPARNNLLTLHI